MLGKKLLVAFSSDSGLPKVDINLFNTKASFSNAASSVSLSEVATLQLEFNDLALALESPNISVSSCQFKQTGYVQQKPSNQK